MLAPHALSSAALVPVRAARKNARRDSLGVEPSRSIALLLPFLCPNVYIHTRYLQSSSCFLRHCLRQQVLHGVHRQVLRPDVATAEDHCSSCALSLSRPLLPEGNIMSGWRRLGCFSQTINSDPRHLALVTAGPPASKCVRHRHLCTYMSTSQQSRLPSFVSARPSLEMFSCRWGRCDHYNTIPGRAQVL